MITTLKQGADVKTIQEILMKISSLPPSKGINAKKYCGIIHLNESPLVIQKKMRDEWE
jgi:hypothetical protein